MTGDRTTTVLAHGLGGSADLPIPYTYALIGAAWALTFTFAVVALAWRKPRFDTNRTGRPLPCWVTAIVDAPAARGRSPQSYWPRPHGSPSPQCSAHRTAGTHCRESSMFCSGWAWWRRRCCAGRYGGCCHPCVPRTVCCRWRGGRPVAYPRRWGYWPAAAGLYLFVWLELASADPGSLGAVKIWLLGYLCVTMAGALACGTRWCAQADPFEVYSMVASRLSPLRRNTDGLIAYGNPFDHLPSLPIRPGMVAVLAVLLGSTAFDSFSAMPEWRGLVDALAQDRRWHRWPSAPPG